MAGSSKLDTPAIVGESLDAPGHRERLIPVVQRLILGAIFAVGAGTPYVLLNHRPTGPATAMAWSVIDAAIPFVPSFAWAYVSFYGLIALPLILARDRSEAGRYVGAGIAAALAGASIFAIAPTLVERPLAPAGSLLALVQYVDAPLNACPSLHAALVTIALVALAGRGRWPALALWGALILASAALVKQHAVVDLLLGSALGLAVAAWLLRPGNDAIAEQGSAAEAATRAAARTIAERAGIDARSFRAHGRWALIPLLAVPFAWVIGVAAIVQGGTLAIIGTLIAAFALNALFLIIHEAVHETLPGPRRLGHLLASSIGLIGFASHAAYRIMHLRHHRYLGDHRDPDDYRNWTASPRRLVVMHHLRLAVATLTYLVAVPVLAWRVASQDERRWILIELAAMIVVHTGGAWTFGALWWQVTIPPLLLANLLINARGLVQHTACVAEDPLRASRSVRAGPLVRALLLNENHHLEHHLFPAVPASRLHELHRAIAPALGGSPTAPSYHGFVLRFIAASARGHQGPML